MKSISIKVSMRKEPETYPWCWHKLRADLVGHNPLPKRLHPRLHRLRFAGWPMGHQNHPEIIFHLTKSFAQLWNVLTCHNSNLTRVLTTLQDPGTQHLVGNGGAYTLIIVPASFPWYYPNINLKCTMIMKRGKTFWKSSIYPWSEARE